MEMAETKGTNHQDLSCTRVIYIYICDPSVYVKDTSAS